MFKEAIHHVVAFAKGTTNEGCDATMVVRTEGGCKRPKGVGGSMSIVLIVELSSTFVILSGD